MEGILLALVVLAAALIYSVNRRRTTRPEEALCPQADPPSPEELRSRICDSKQGRLFADTLCAFFSKGNEHFDWLACDSAAHMYRIEVFKSGVYLSKVERARKGQWKAKTHTIHKEHWGFVAAGFEDLPTPNHARVFQTFLLEEIRARCPLVAVYGNLVTAADSSSTAS